jgi:hypothetical protein
MAPSALGPSERSSCCLRPETSQRNPRKNQLVDSSRRGRQRLGVELGEDMFGLVKAPDQKEAPDLETPRMRGVQPVAVLLKRRPGCLQRLRRPTQIPRDERDLGLGDDTPRACHGLSRTKGACGASQERLRSHQIAESRHRDAAERERRSVVAQGYPVQRAEVITLRQRARRGGYRQVNRNPDTLVTLTVQSPTLIYLTTTNQHVVN